MIFSLTKTRMPGSESVVKESLYVRFGKRFFDMVAASFGILLLLPFLALVALAVKLSSRGPVLFRQTRVGQFGRLFQILKLRSMRTGSESGSQLTASGDARVTPLGSWLRRTKIDELPQLFNVVVGDMSLVGPRPEVPEFTSYYTEEQRKVLQVRPGITAPGTSMCEEELLAGRADKESFYISTVLPAKLESDLDYCLSIKFRTDLHILFQTLAKLLIRLYEPYKKISHSSFTSFETRADRK